MSVSIPINSTRNKINEWQRELFISSYGIDKRFFLGKWEKKNLAGGKRQVGEKKALDLHDCLEPAHVPHHVLTLDHLDLWHTVY